MKMIWRSKKSRAITLQALLLFVVGLVCIVALNNAAYNLENQGIATGFSFLDSPAGFNIIQTLIEYESTSTYARAFWVSLLNTLLLAFMGIVCATLIGFVFGIMRLSKNWLVAKLATAYVETFRNIPLLLQIFFWYIAVLRHLPLPRNSYNPFEHVFLNVRGLYVPKLIPTPGIYWVMISTGLALICVWILVRAAKKIQEETGIQIPVFWASLLMSSGIIGLSILLIGGLPFHIDYPELKGFNFVGGLEIIPELVAMLVSLTVYTSTFIAEIVRAGIMSVDKGQIEAAQALGMNNRYILKLIIMPQAMRVIIPPLTNQYLNLTKNTSLGAAIAYPELVSVFAGTVLNQTGQAIETISISMGVYLMISLSISLIMNRYNKRLMRIKER